MDLGQSLRSARELRLLTRSDAAAAAGISMLEIEAFETGALERLPDQVDTLAALRRYATSLNLNGNAFVVAAVDFWPNPRRLTWANEREHRYLVPVSDEFDDSITGMVDLVGPKTGPVAIVSHGRPDEFGAGAPTSLKVLVALVAVLVLLGAGALIERPHVAGWYHGSVSTVSNWFGNSSNAPAQHHRRVVAVPPPKVSIVNGPASNEVTFNVSAKSFTVKMAAFKYPCWMEVTQAGQAKPIYEQVMPGGDFMAFTVSSSDVIRTASGSGRAYVYEGSKFIGYYFPSRAPFTLTFNAVGAATN
jgi:transcriptional regulator with XRE-family HTH domain